MSMITKLTGNLTGDPETRTVTVRGEQRKIVEFRVFSDVYREDAQGNLVQDDEKCTGVDVTVWQERLGSRVAQLLRRGCRVSVEGEMILRRYKDRETQEPRANLQMSAETVHLVLSRIDEIKFTASRNQREEAEAGTPA